MRRLNSWRNALTDRTAEIDTGDGITALVPLDRGYTIDESAGRVVKVWDYLNKREQIIYGNTGVRDIDDELEPGISSSSFRLQRTGNIVVASTQGVLSTTAGHITLYKLPIGFRPNNASVRAGLAYSSNGVVYQVSPYIDRLRVLDMPANYNVSFGVQFATDDPWPTSLPGIASGIVA